MKKINLLFSTLVLALALLVCGAATVAPVMQAQTLSLQTASNSDGKLSGAILFDELGRYAVSRNTLEKGLTVENEKHTYKFFGHDWRLVKVDGNYATFWMADPYTKTYFNQIDKSYNGLAIDGSNVWTNGYSKTVWKPTDATIAAQYENGQTVLDNDGGSDIRKFLYEEAKTMLDDKAYSKYKDKVVPGYVTGHNQPNDTASKVVDYLSFAKDSLDDVQRSANQQQLTAYYDLDSSDRLWLPSVGDLQIWNVLDENKVVLKPRTLGWTETTVSGAYAWLREANPQYSEYARVISPSARQVAGESYASYFHAMAVKQEAGVRPAIHLDISKIDEEYEDHINNPSGKKNWWDDDWLKILFITVVILGTVGLILVVVGVIVKVRHTRQTHEA